MGRPSPGQGTSARAGVGVVVVVKRYWRKVVSGEWGLTCGGSDGPWERGSLTGGGSTLALQSVTF